MSSRLTPKVSSDDDLNFLTKSSKSSRLSSLFSDPLRKDSMDSSSNSSLRYVPPKQPKPGSSDVASNVIGGCTTATITGSSSITPASANPVLVAIKVEAFVLKDNAFSSVGAAVCCVLSGKQSSAQSHTLLLYQNPKMPLARVTINVAFTFTVQTSDCAFFRDVENRCWSVKAGPDQLLDLLRQVGVCRILSSNRGGAVMVQPLSPSPSDITVLQPGDWAEVTVQPLAVKGDRALDKLPPDAACERVRLCVAASAVLQQEGGSGGAWWASALQGAGRGERRLALLLDDTQDCNEVKACEVVVEKIKKRKRMSKSPAVPSPIPSLALAGCGEGGTAAAAAGEAAVTALPPAASETVQDDPRARVLSRIARVGQSVFGAPLAVSTVTAAAAVTPTQASTETPISASAAVTTSKAEQTPLSDSELDWEDGLVTQGQSASSTQLGESCTAAAAASIPAPVTAVPSSACSSHSQRSPAATSQPHTTLPHSTHTPLPHVTRAGGDAGDRAEGSPHPGGLSHHPNAFYPISSPQPGYFHQATGQSPYPPAAAPNISPHMHPLTVPEPSYGVIGTSIGPLAGHASYQNHFSSQGPPSSAVHLSPFSPYPTQYHDHSSPSNAPYQSHYHRQPPPPPTQYGGGAATAADPALSLIFSESRAQNTELRIALAKMADQVTDLQVKMSAVQDSSRTGEAHTGLCASLDARLTELIAAQQIRDSAGADTLATLEQQVRQLHQAVTVALGGEELPSQGATDESASSVPATLKLVGQLVRLIQEGKLASGGLAGERLSNVEEEAKGERETALEKEVKDLRDQLEGINVEYLELHSEMEMVRLKEKSFEHLHERWLECVHQEAHSASELLPLTECAPIENDPVWFKAYKDVFSLNLTLRNQLKRTEDVTCDRCLSKEEEASVYGKENVALKEQIEHLKLQIVQIKLETKEIKAEVVDANELLRQCQNFNVLTPRIRAEIELLEAIAEDGSREFVQMLIDEHMLLLKQIMTWNVDPQQQQLSQDGAGANGMHPPQLLAPENSLRPEQRVAALERLRQLLQEHCQQRLHVDQQRASADLQREQHQLKQQEELEQQRQTLELRNRVSEQLGEEAEQRKREVIQKEEKLQQERRDIEEEKKDLEEQKHQQKQEKQMLGELKEELVQQKLELEERRGQTDPVLEGKRKQISPDASELEALKQDKERLEAELQRAQVELSGLSVLRMREREQSEERLAELNQSRAGVELELLELSGAQQTMEREVEALRQQTVQLRQLARARKTVSGNALPGSRNITGHDGRTREAADEESEQAEEQFEQARRKNSVCTQTACCDDAESSGKSAARQQSDVAAGLSVEEVEATLKRVMNAVYKGTKAKFGAEQHYDGSSIRQALLAVIKETTFQYLTSITLEREQEKPALSTNQSNAQERVEASKMEDPSSANNCNGIEESVQTVDGQTVAPPNTQQYSSWQQSMLLSDRFPANDCRVVRQEGRIVEVNTSNGCDSAVVSGISNVNRGTCDAVDGAAERQETNPVTEEDGVRERENSPDRTATVKNRPGDDDGGEGRSDDDDGEKDRSDNDEDNAAENILKDVTKRIGAADDGSDSSSGEYDICRDASNSSEEQTSSERVDYLDDEAARTALGCKALGEHGLCKAGEEKGSDNVMGANMQASGGDTERDTSTLIEGKESNKIFGDDSFGVVIENNASKMVNERNVSLVMEEPLIVDPQRPEDKDRPYPPTKEGNRDDQLRGAPLVHQEPLGLPHQVSSTPLPHPPGEEKVWSLNSHPPPLPLFSDDEDDDNWLS